MSGEYCNCSDPRGPECKLTRSKFLPDYITLPLAKSLADADEAERTGGKIGRLLDDDPAGPGEFEARATDVYAQAHRVLLQKHRDYGPKNISQSPGGPLNGLRVRIWDKLARINNLVDSGAEPENESLRDSFLDLANYSLIALMVLDGDWPE